MYMTDNDEEAMIHGWENWFPSRIKYSYCDNQHETAKTQNTRKSQFLMKMSIIVYIPQYSSKTPDDDKLCRDSSPHADGMGVYNQIFIFVTPAHAATSSHRWE